ncbi:MAG TPA: flagellar biosynthetic protein FliO [Cellvibrio sp.]|nr:flagellar biosynthetic protein FliO [Cellvibrio sp.]
MLLRMLLVPLMIAGLSLSAYAATSSAASAYSSAPAANNAKVAAASAAAVPNSNFEAATPVSGKNNPAAVNAAPRIGSGTHLLNVTLGLSAIIALIFALSFFVKRFGSGSFSANTQLKIISSMPLGTRERIVLIDAAGQQLLLGITPTNINTLHVFAEPIAVDNKAEVQSDFSRKLMAILQQKTPPSPDRKSDSASQE